MTETRKSTIRERRQDHLYKRHQGCPGTVEPDLDSDLRHQRDSGGMCDQLLISCGAALLSWRGMQNALSFLDVDLELIKHVTRVIVRMFHGRHASVSAGRTA